MTSGDIFNGWPEDGEPDPKTLDMSDHKQEAIESLATTVREQYVEIEHLRDERNEWCRRYKKAKAELKRANAALRTARDAIASLPIDALGEADNGHMRWPLRDELIDKLTKVLAALETE